VTGNVSGNAATVTTNANLTGAVTSVGNATTMNSALDDLTDVVISTPAVDEFLRYNGAAWVNGAGATSSAGPGIEFFNATPNLIAANTQNEFAVNSLSKTPIVTAEQTISGTATSNTVAFAAWLYNTALGRTTIDAGIWQFETYCAVNSIAGGRVTTLTRQIYCAKPFATGTVTITGTGTSRTATASAGTPFAVTEIDASATNTTASYLQTPNGLFQITARTSDTAVTINTLSTYTNESAVAGTVWKKLFGATTSPVTATGTNYSLSSFSTSQASFTIDATCKLGAISFVTSNNTTTLTLTYNGNTRNSHFTTPLITLHNNLAGLQGGAANEYYHMTSAQATVLGNTSGTNTGDNAANSSSLPIAGGTMTGNITLGENTAVALDPAGSADEKWSGITCTGTAGATLAVGDLIYLDVTATEWLLADADAAATSGDVPLGLCILAANDGQATNILLIGTMRSAAFPASIALGAPVYVSTTAGDIQAAQPSGTDDVIRRVGWAITAEPNTIYFNPSNDYVTHV
jgi:hypothetical protein